MIRDAYLAELLVQVSMPVTSQMSCPSQDPVRVVHNQNLMEKKRQMHERDREGHSGEASEFEQVLQSRTG